MKQDNNSLNSESKREIDKLDKRKIGKIISENRKANGLTQTELAEKLGLSFQAVSNWECGNTLPDLSNILELSNLFNVNINILLGKEETNSTALHEQNEHELTQYDIKALQLLKDVTESNTANIGRMIQLTPFLSQSTVNQIINELCRKITDIKYMVAFAPFSDKKTIDAVIEYKYSQGFTAKDMFPLLPFASSNYMNSAINVDVDINVDNNSMDKHNDLNKNGKQSVTVEKISELSEILNDDVLEDVIYDYLEVHHTVGHIIELFELDIPFVCDYVQDFVLDNSDIYSVDDLIELYDNDIIIDDLFEAVSDKKLTTEDLKKLKDYLDDYEILKLFNINM